LLTDLLIQRALQRRYGNVTLTELNDATEHAAHQAALDLALKFKGTMSAIDAAWQH